MTITDANVWKVIAFATATYWAVAGGVIWTDVRSGGGMNESGSWIGLVLLTGLCGTGFWAMVTPAGIQAFHSNRSLFDLKKIGVLL